MWCFKKKKSVYQIIVQNLEQSYISHPNRILINDELLEQVRKSLWLLE
jgi:hypothetical protein